MTIELTAALPRWDLSNLYPGLESAAYAADFAALRLGLEELQRDFDAHEIRRLPEPPARSEAELAAILRGILNKRNQLALLEGKLDAFTTALLTSNSYDPLAARETSRLEVLGIARKKLDVRFGGWVGSLADESLAALCRRPELEPYAFYLRDAARQSKFLMPEELENLAAELCVDSGTAWGKLQGNVTSQLKVPLERDGRVELLPIAQVHNFCFHPDAALRRRAYEAELAGWKSVRTSVAACLNGVKGTAITLARRRGRPSVLDAALDANRIDRATLDALLGAIEEAFPMFRRYLSAKARKLGHASGVLPWWDLFAPLGAEETHFSWRQARDFIVEKFGTFSDELGQFAARAFDRRWIDAGPRDGKRGGAYCMPITALEESRILANFDGSFEQVSTLAHELGHGFHNHCQAELEPLRRGEPSTLAETASIFCETLVANAALEGAPAEGRLMILEAQLANATQVCLDISSRFRFESALFAGRAESELSPEELCGMMTKAQGETYGEAVDPATYHPYMWLWKPHYYSYEGNFYNFPYAFGHLFGLGLYAIYRREPASFVGRYRELLRATGQDYAAPLAARFGLDITGRDFWRGSVQIVAEQIQRYETL